MEYFLLSGAEAAYTFAGSNGSATLDYFYKDEAYYGSSLQGQRTPKVIAKFQIIMVIKHDAASHAGIFHNNIASVIPNCIFKSTRGNSTCTSTPYSSTEQDSTRRLQENS